MRFTGGDDKDEGRVGAIPSRPAGAEADGESLEVVALGTLGEH